MSDVGVGVGDGLMGMSYQEGTQGCCQPLPFNQEAFELGRDRDGRIEERVFWA